jgi:hypothetical protein
MVYSYETAIPILDRAIKYRQNQTKYLINAGFSEEDALLYRQRYEVERKTKNSSKNGNNISASTNNTNTTPTTPVVDVKVEEDLVKGVATIKSNVTYNSSVVGNILTADDLLKLSGHHDDYNIVKKSLVINSNNNIGLNVTAVRKPSSLKALNKLILNDFNDIRQKSPSSFDIRTYSTTGSNNSCLLELSPFDLHLGKSCHINECGDSYDLAIAQVSIMKALQNLIKDGTKWNIDKVLLVIGQDFLHVDNSKNETTRGTLQDVDGKFRNIYTIGAFLLKEMVELCLQVGPVHVINVPGNHAEESDFSLGVALQYYYMDSKYVTVDNSIFPRKYYKYHNNLIGLSHGDKGKIDTLPGLMSRDRAKDWAECDHKYIHLGHLHHKKDFIMKGDEINGVRMTVLPSLSAADYWHNCNGYVAKRAAEGFVYDKQDGCISNLMYNFKHSDATDSDIQYYTELNKKLLNE